MLCAPQVDAGCKDLAGEGAVAILKVRGGMDGDGPGTAGTHTTRIPYKVNTLPNSLTTTTAPKKVFESTAQTAQTLPKRTEICDSPKDGRGWPDRQRPALPQVNQKFRPDLNDEQAEAYFNQLINDSVNALFPVVFEKLHKLAVYLK